MRSQSLRILMIGLFSLWFGIIVPGHERGAIRVAGAPAPASSDDACPPVASSCDHCPLTAPASTSPTPGDPSQHCAICKHIGLLDVPVMVHFDPPAVHLLATLEPTLVQSLSGVSFISTDRGRGPPVIAI